jgi:hypothetical protein
MSFIYAEYAIRGLGPPLWGFVSTRDRVPRPLAWADIGPPLSGFPNVVWSGDETFEDVVFVVELLRCSMCVLNVGYSGQRIDACRTSASSVATRQPYVSPG